MLAAQAQERRRAERVRRRGRPSALPAAPTARARPARSRPRARGGGTAGSRARAAAPARRPGSAARRGCAASVSGRASGWNVWTSTRPGASRPLRPASWVTSWNVRSSARKSGRPRPVSASTTAASSTPAKWWPLATICVPSSTARSVSRKRRSAAGQLLRVRGSVGVEPDQLELRHLRRELPLQPLRAGTDPRDLGRAADRALLRLRLDMAAVMAVQPLVAVQHERDVAVRAAEGRPAGAAVERRRDPAAVEQQDRLAAALGDPRRARRAAAPRAGSRPRGAGRRRAPAAASRRAARAARAARSRSQLSGRGVALP